MLVRELKSQLETFRSDTIKYRDLWGESLEGPLPEYPVTSFEALSEQSASLLRRLGLLRPYLEDLSSTWVLTANMGSVSWNILDHSLGHHGAHLKGPSLNALIDGIQSVLGRLDDYLPEQVFRIGALTTTDAEIELAERICSRVSRAARILSGRRSGKDTFEIVDEYDVQDLLHALFRAYFKYPVAENPLSKIAGAASGRADLCIEELGLIVEVKFVRTERNQGIIERALAEDLVFYSAWMPLRYVFFVVFNSADLKDAELLDRFSKPQAINEKHFTSKVINV